MCSLLLTKIRFSHRVIKYWNALPQATRQMSVQSFKVAVKIVLEEAQKFLNFDLDFNIVSMYS